MYRKKQTGDECCYTILKKVICYKIDQIDVEGVDYQIGQMITPRSKLPDGIIHKIGEGNDRPVS